MRALALAISVALGGGPNAIAVAPPKVVGDVPAGWHGRLGAALAKGAGREGQPVVSPRDVAKKLGDTRCSTAACWAQVARGVQAEHIVVTEIRAVDDIYTVTLTLLRRDGTEAATSEEKCEICGLTELVDHIANQSAVLRAKVSADARALPVLEIRSEPSAQIAIDGKAIGETPVRREVDPGRRSVRATRVGYLPQERIVVGQRGLTETVAFQLRPAPRDRRPTQMLHAGAALLGIGLGGAVAGAVLMGIDGQDVTRGDNCSGANRNPAGCRYEHDTLNAGAGILAAGLAVSVVGSVLLGIALKRRRKR